MASLALQAKPGLVGLWSFHSGPAPNGADPYGHRRDLIGSGLIPAGSCWSKRTTDKGGALPGPDEDPRTRAAGYSLAIARCKPSRPDGQPSVELGPQPLWPLPWHRHFMQRRTAGGSAAATRWRIGSHFIPASRDRFGAVLNPRWSVSLERCRHGRPGTWFVEWDHVAHRFSLGLVAVRSDRSPTQGAGLAAPVEGRINVRCLIRRVRWCSSLPAKGPARRCPQQGGGVCWRS